jgi:predicted O-linked N-acetylglucosamine transferase (SPINDLY family)
MSHTDHPATSSALKGLRLPPIARAPSAPALHGGPAAHQAWAQGVALVRKQHDAQALPHLKRATQLAPGVPLYWLNRAGAERRLRLTSDAIGSARRAFELDCSSPLACQMLAELQRMNNRDADALRTLRSYDPRNAVRDARHWLLEGSVLMALQDWQAAAQAFLQVLQQRPADVEAYMQLGFALANLRRFGEAAECFRTVTILEPAEFGAAVYAAHYNAWSCDWTQGAQDHERMLRALELQEGRTETPSFSPFCLLSMNDDAALHLRAARMEGARIAAAVRETAGWTAPAAGAAGHPEAWQALHGGRIRVGFVSADFRTHATSILMVQTLERLDRTRFEVHLYSHGSDDHTPLRARMVAAADSFVDCSTMNTVEQAARIRADGVALLVDMSGYTGSSRLGVFALRPAPVQALWLAYPSTTGSDFIDYIIGDPILTPLAHAADFSEQIAQLPLCYEPTDEEREHPEPLSRAECGLPDEAFVYACFNQSYKINEDVFARWCRILDQVPGSVLWLLVPQQEIQAALHARATERGVATERVIFAPFVSPSQHLARLPQADLFLDTFPYGAHTTCSDALWMGLPVLTQRGRSFSARVAASLLHAVGLPELAVDSEQDYEHLAVALARDGTALTDIRDHLWNNRRDLALFDNTRFSAEFGKLVERLVGHWRDGGLPQPMPAV